MKKVLTIVKLLFFVLVLTILSTGRASNNDQGGSSGEGLHFFDVHTSEADTPYSQGSYGGKGGGGGGGGGGCESEGGGVVGGGGCDSGCESGCESGGSESCA